MSRYSNQINQRFNGSSAMDDGEDSVREEATPLSTDRVRKAPTPTAIDRSRASSVGQACSAEKQDGSQCDNEVEADGLCHWHRMHSARKQKRTLKLNVSETESREAWACSERVFAPVAIASLTDADLGDTVTRDRDTGQLSRWEWRVCGGAFESPVRSGLDDYRSFLVLIHEQTNLRTCWRCHREVYHVKSATLGTGIGERTVYQCRDEETCGSVVRES